MGLNKVMATKENMTIFLEILKFYGRDLNLVEVYTLFKEIHLKYRKACMELPPATQFAKLEVLDCDVTFRQWVMRALSDLKFMGIVSTTRQNTFIFKKNIFGKAKYFKDDVPDKTSEEQIAIINKFK